MPSSLFHTLHISRQDLLSRMADLDLTSHNLANINTAGYKATRSNFQELLQGQFKEGDLLANTQMLTTQGSLAASENPLDWAILGEGFFPLLLPNGETAYTRSGQFQLDASGQLVNPNGYPLVWEGEIPADVSQISITSAGAITAQLADGSTQNLGTVSLARFSNPSGLASQGDNTWLATDLSGEAQIGTPGAEGFGALQPYYVEQSNVQLSQELSHLVTLQHAFTMSIRAFQQTDEMLALAIHMRKA
jgi:flagellar basal-body rod protein FlgG